MESMWENRSRLLMCPSLRSYPTSTTHVQQPKEARMKIEARSSLSSNPKRNWTSRCILVASASILLWLHLPRSSDFLFVQETRTQQRNALVAHNNITLPRKIFLDLGANCGNTYHKYMQDSSAVLNDGTSWEVYLWEPNPQMHQFFLDELAQRSTLHRVEVIKAAAGTTNGTIELFLHKGQDNVDNKMKFLDGGRCDPKSPYSPAGGVTVFGNAKVATGKSVNVPLIDFVNWLQQLHIREQDYLFFKIDIEGAELPILEELLKRAISKTDDSICRVSEFSVEWHRAIFPDGSAEYAEHDRYAAKFRERFQEACGKPLNVRTWVNNGKPYSAGAKR